MKLMPLPPFIMSDFSSPSSLHNPLASVCGSLSSNLLEHLLIVTLNILYITCNGMLLRVRSQI